MWLKLNDFNFLHINDLSIIRNKRQRPNRKSWMDIDEVTGEDATAVLYDMQRMNIFVLIKNIVFLSEWATYFPFIETILVNYFLLLLFLESFENINKAYPSNTAVMVQSPTFSNIVKDLPGRPLETSWCLWFKNHLSDQK